MTARYTVIVRGLVLMCRIGIRPQEQGREQRVRVSVELEADAAAGFPGGDRREDRRKDRHRIINYERIVGAIRDIAAGSRAEGGHIDLCEGFAERVCAACFADKRVAVARITVEKLDVFPDAESVGAILERRRDG